MEGGGKRKGRKVRIVIKRIVRIVIKSDLVVGEDNMRVFDNENKPTFVKNC